MFEVKRKDREFVELKLGDEVLKVIVEDTMNKYKTYVRATHTIEILTDKMHKLEESGNLGDEFFQIYGQAVIDLLECVFDKEQMQKITDFFDGDYDEAIEMLIPFIQGEWTEALNRARAKRSKEKIEAIQGRG